MKDYMELDSAAQDMLKELGNIGTGNAITALSAMLGKEIVMECPEVRVVGFNEVPDTLGGMVAIRVGVLVQTGGDISGIFMFLISESFTQVMLEQLLGFPVEAGAYDELASSAIAEVGNIMCCSYINALSSLLGFKVDVSVPEVSRDMVGSLLSVPIIYFADHSDNLLLIEDRYFIDDQSIVSHVLFLPNLESLKRIFSAVGEPYGR